MERRVAELLRLPALAGALPVLSLLEEAGFEAAIVGGAVRDAWLGRPIHDVDIATSALPEQVQAVFARTFPTGIQHGTVTAVYGGSSYEITTYRTEAAYVDHRRPSSVAYVTQLANDLLRRDFTINAMAIFADGRLCDPYGGTEDMNRRLIRCVGEPEQRFTEDALRMMRCIRFAAELGYTVEERTWQALHQCKPLLRHVAMERVGAELCRMLAGSGPDEAVSMLSRSGLLSAAKQPPEGLATRLASLDTELPALHPIAGLERRFAALWLGVASDAGAQLDAAIRQLHIPRIQAKRIEAIIRLDEALAALGLGLKEAAPAPHRDEAPERRHWAEQALRHGLQAAVDWLSIQPALNKLPAPVIARISGWMDAMAIWSIGELAISGKDVEQLARRKPGPWIREVLDQLLLNCALGAVPNRPEPLRNYALQLLNGVLPNG